MTDRAALRARHQRATQAVDDLCQGRLRWEMRVPAEPDHDPDLIISDSLRDIPDLLRDLDAAQAAVRDLVEAADDLWRQADAYRRGVGEANRYLNEDMPSHRALVLAMGEVAGQIDAKTGAIVAAREGTPR